MQEQFLGQWLPEAVYMLLLGLGTKPIGLRLEKYFGLAWILSKYLLKLPLSPPYIPYSIILWLWYDTFCRHVNMFSTQSHVQIQTYCGGLHVNCLTIYPANWARTLRLQLFILKCESYIYYWLDPRKLTFLQESKLFLYYSYGWVRKSQPKHPWVVLVSREITKQLPKCQTFT